MSARDIRKHRLALADRVIAIALRYVDDLVAAGVDPERISLIDDAVDMTLFDPTTVDAGFLQREQAVSGGPVVGLVGRISPFKRVVEFLEIIARVPVEQRRDVQFVIVGEWEDADYREKVEQTMARLGLFTCVRFIGRCTSETMPHVLAGFDLLVTLSGGSVMFEAMALGVPVLTVRDEARPMQHTRHGETAWCVNNPDLAVAAQALARLITDASERQRLGAHARAWVRARLSVESMVTKTRAVYDALREG
jgi:glycosyltransferase involved in cell wall biosynthesis